MEGNCDSWTLLLFFSLGVVIATIVISVMGGLPQAEELSSCQELKGCQYESDVPSQEAFCGGMVESYIKCGDWNDYFVCCEKGKVVPIPTGEGLVSLGDGVYVYYLDRNLSSSQSTLECSVFDINSEVYNISVKSRKRNCVEYTQR